MKINLLVTLGLITLSIIACGSGDESARSDKAVAADKLFWDWLHGQNNQTVYETIARLDDASGEDPSDVFSIAHIGWAQFWASTEGARRGLVKQDAILGHLREAQKAFQRALKMAPNEPRIQGFLGYTHLALEKVLADPAVVQQGHHNILQSIRLWPEWAYFGAAYGLDAQTPVDSPSFQQALNYYWASLDACANESVNRNNPSWAIYMDRETQTGVDRACWNSWIAPHNVEGFFLIMGDAMVKAGNTTVANILYENAKIQRHYETWAFRHVLETRIANIEANVAIFRENVFPVRIETSLIVRTHIVCAICHHGNADAYYDTPDWIGANANHYLQPFSK